LQAARLTTPADKQPLTCAERGRKPRPNETPQDEWRAFFDIGDALPVFCPECAEREVSED